ncbi:IS5 family transposase, partial [Akkermansiaceae bacterium]|nr:IS5 family transposase [Akkermansiaceae bacterium]
MPEYPSSLTDSEWEILEWHLPKNHPGIRGRPRENSRRSIINGILCIIRTGGAWRMMPNDLPHWKTCYYYFRLWAKQGYWEKIHHAIRDKARLKVGKKKAPTAAILDSQSIRTASQPGLRGYDAGKRITGRKRHVLVDTLGFILALKVTTADVQDRDGARSLMSTLTSNFGWLKRIWADGGYSGKLVEEVAQIQRHRQIDLEIVKRSDEIKGFKVLPKRWIVERTFGWLIQSRRLIRDHEVLIKHSESQIYLSMTK